MGEATRVYVVTSGRYSDYGIEAIFSTREAAEAYVAEGRKRRDDELNDVDEWTLDERAGRKAVLVHRAAAIYGTGEVVAHAPRWDWWDHAGRSIASEDAWAGRAAGGAWGYGVTVESSVSAEHAAKVAVERRQEWLRARAAQDPQGADPNAA